MWILEIKKFSVEGNVSYHLVLELYRIYYNVSNAYVFILIIILLSYFCFLALKVNPGKTLNRK